MEQAQLHGHKWYNTMSNEIQLNTIARWFVYFLIWWGRVRKAELLTDATKHYINLISMHGSAGVHILF